MSNPLFDILAQCGPSDDVYAVRDPMDGMWLGTADEPSLFRDKIVGGNLQSAKTRAKMRSVMMQVQLGRSFEFALYDGGQWKDTVLGAPGKQGIRFT